MSLIDKFIEAMIKAETPQPQPQSTPQLQPTPQPQPTPQLQPTPQPQPVSQPQPAPEVDYKAEYEKLLTSNTNLQKQLAEAQSANINLLNKLPIGGHAQTLSEILRGESYHPLHREEKK